MNDPDVIFLAGLGIVMFFIGLGVILNGMFLTVPRKGLVDRSSEADRQRVLDGTVNNTSDLRLPASPAADAFSSVTEHTTRHLEEKQPESFGKG